MPEISGELNLDVMYGSHAAMRRDLEALARLAEQSGPGGEPARVLAVADSWATFKRQLHGHHVAEDTVIWPALRERLAARSEALSVLDEMEQEHGLVDPLLAAVEAAFGGPGADLAAVVGELATTLAAHLDHEEKEAIPLVTGNLTVAEWGLVQAGIKALPGAAAEGPEMFAWILRDAPDAEVDRVLAPLPPVVKQLFYSEWRPAYDAVERW